MVAGATLTLLYDEALDEDSEPAATDFAVTVAGSARTVSGVDVTGSAVVLTLSSAVIAGQAVRVSYTKGTNPIRDTHANHHEAASFSGEEVDNRTGDTAVPRFQGATVQGTALTLAYDEGLDPAHEPPAGSFTVTVNASGVTVNGVAVRGRTVVLTLASAVALNAPVEVLYTLPATATDRIQDFAGNTASAIPNTRATHHGAPSADAGADVAVAPGAAVTLSGSGTDADGTIQGYAWSQVEGTTVTLQNAGTARATFTAPDTAGALVFRLTVTDNLGVTDTDDVTVTVSDAPPVFAEAVPTLRLEPDEAMTPVVLPAATGGNGGPYGYALASDPAGLAGLSFDAATRTLSGTPDTERGRWTFTYTAHDGDANTAASDAAVLDFRVTVGMAPEVQRRAVTRTVAALATRTVASALDTIGTRLGDAVPGTTLTLAGEAVPLAASGAAAGWRDGTACPAPGFGADGIGRGGSGTGLGQAGFGAGFGEGLGTRGCGVPRSRGVDADGLLSTSAFSLTLGAAEGEPGFDAKAARWSVWGRGDLGYFAGRPEPGMHYRGETRTGWLGVDARGSTGGATRLKSWVAGLAVSHGTSGSDYSYEGGADPAERGRLETVLGALWPYGRWSFGNGLELRGMLGAGTGSLRHIPGGGDAAEKSKLTMWTVSLGFKRKLSPRAGFDLAAQGDASFVRKETARGEQTIDGLRADSWRGRLGLEGSRRIETEGGRSFTPFLELAARQDGGDGLTGTGLEVAGGLRHGAPGIDVELRGRWLAAHTQEGTEEHGVSLTARMLPGDRGRGLSLSLSPRWGAATGGADALWRDEMPKGGPGGGAERGAVELRAGYGFAAFGDRFTATPNAAFSQADGGGRDYRIGWRLDSAVGGAPGFEVNLDVTRHEGSGGEPPENGIELHGTIRW